MRKCHVADWRHAGLNLKDRNDDPHHYCCNYHRLRTGSWQYDDHDWALVLRPAQAGMEPAQLGIWASLDSHSRHGRLVGSSGLGSLRGAGERLLVAVLFGVNIILYMLWSPLFFNLRRPDWALIEVPFLWLSIMALMIGLAPLSTLASLLLALSALGSFRGHSQSQHSAHESAIRSVRLRRRERVAETRRAMVDFDPRF